MKHKTLYVLMVSTLIFSACNSSSQPRMLTSSNSSFSKKPQDVDLEKLETHGVTTQIANFKGRVSTKVELSDITQKMIALKGPAAGGNSFALADVTFDNGIIEFDIAGEVNGKGMLDSRGFVGLAFHISEDLKTFDTVFFRMSNGNKNKPEPPAPQNARAIQYSAYPDFRFNVSREKFPGQYEAAAPVALSTWHKVRLEINGARVDAFVDSQPVLSIKNIFFANRKGKIGLWVDNGSTGYFSNLKILKAN